jgi:hypothetical protein
VISASVLGSLLRRWYVVVAGILLAVLVFGLFSRSSAVYESESTIVFVSPGEAPITGVDDNQTDSLVAFATLIQTQMNDSHTIARLASANATLFGAGIRQGYQVAVPNYGGQWQESFPNPDIDVQVVGPTAAWVQSTQNRLLDRIQKLTVSSQQKLGVPKDQWIVASLAAPNPVQFVGASKGMRERGLLALLAVGFCLSACGATLLDRALRRRKARRTLHEEVHRGSSNRQIARSTRPPLTRPQRGPAS